MRRRISALVAATTSVVLLAFLVPAAVLVGRVARADAESRAQSSLQALVPLVAAGETTTLPLALDRASTAGLVAWITGAGGVAVGDDPSGGAFSARTAAGRGETADPAGVLLTQPVSRDGTTSVVHVFVPEAELSDGVLRIRAVLFGLGLLLFVAALLVADRLARSIARPVTDLAGVAGELGAGDLEARVRPAGPAEVQEVGVALNRLAGRIGELLAAERESVADLSHRLRTPVTALRLEAGSLRDPAERDRLRDAVDALDRAVDAVIREARAPVVEALGTDPRCDAAEVARTRLAFWSVLAREEERPVTGDIPASPVPARVPAADLGAALDALLGNVFAHTPVGTGFALAVRARGERVEVVVGDDGPGLPAAALLERGRSGGGSTGLGLSIARRTAGGAAGEVRLARRPSGGLEVTLDLAAG